MTQREWDLFENIKRYVGFGKNGKSDSVYGDDSFYHSLEEKYFPKEFDAAIKEYEFYARQHNIYN